jgi:hypothetical protein
MTLLYLRAILWLVTNEKLSKRQEYFRARQQNVEERLSQNKDRDLAEPQGSQRKLINVGIQSKASLVF